eukprot:EG_transcript_43626
MVLSLPIDTLELIAELLQTSELSHLCQALWDLLGRRYVHCNVNGDNAWQRLQVVIGYNLRRLTLGGRDVQRSGLAAIARVADAPRLHTVEVRLARNEVGDGGALALASLKHACNLRTLVLDLQGNQIADQGAKALAQLR